MSIGIVLSLKASDWKSCTRIVSNLLKSYTHFLEEDFKIYDFSREATSRDRLNLSRQIQNDSIKHLIFLDHRPHPLELIKNLSQQAHKLEQITFHLYGDFMLDIKEWFEVGKFTKTIETKYVTASLKQQKVVKKIFSHKSENVFLCPFPVDKKDFSFDPSVRKRERKKLNIKDDEFVFLYTGRLSHGKQIIPLINCYEKLKKVMNAKARIYLAGLFDNIVNPLTHSYGPHDYYRYAFQDVYFNFPKEVRDSIYYLGPQDTQSLFKLYNLSDSFISLSLYHDEDYGMSPVEALFCGSDAILTDWGGYHSFAIDPKSCSLVQTSFDKFKGASFQQSQAIKRMMKTMIKRKTEEERLDTSKSYYHEFSIEACASKLQEIMEKNGKPFQGFSELGREVLKKKNPFLNDRGTFSQLYFETYKDYISE